MAKQNKPAIRFKGFTDAWEQRKVGELIEDYIEKTTVQNQYPVLTSSQQQGIVFQEDYFADRQVTTNDNIGYYVLPYGYFTYRSRSDTDVFVFNRNNIIDRGIISYYYPVFLPKDCDSNFLLRRLNHGIKKQLSMAAEGTGQKVLAHNKFKNMVVDVPEIKEQQKIGLYFESLDHLITLHQRKYDKLQVLKKAMLEKMFPKNGSSVPEIRFKGFTDAWEQRKLGEIYGLIGNAFVGTATPYYVEQGHFYLESNNVKDGQINHNSEIFINDEFYEKQKDKWLHTGDMVMVQSGHVGHAAVIPEVLDNTAAHALIMFRNPKEKIEPYFLNFEYQTNKSKKKIENITTGNTIKHILASDMQEFEVDVPKYEEQKAIAEYFANLDNLITLHQRELEKLQNIKKSMLEKMFV